MNRLTNLCELVIPFYTKEDPAHNWPHIQRVVATVSLLAANENIKLPCLIAAAYCHDLINLPKNHPDRHNASTLTAEKASSLLKEAHFNEEEIKFIQQIIIEHSFSKGMRPTTLEASILQDADRMDALGAIGILRCASVNTQMKSSFYDANDPLAKNRELNDREFMLDHYFVKLFKLPELMNTPRAKTMAKERVQFMQQFIDSLMTETGNLY